MRSRPAIILRPAPAALPRPVPTAPLEHPTCGGHLHETSTGVHSRSPITPARLAAAPGPGSSRLPPVFSSPAAPGWDKGRFGFFPGLRTPQLPATHARAETGQCALTRVIRLRHQPGLQRRLPLALMHPHVARNPPWPPSRPGSPPGTPGDQPSAAQNASWPDKPTPPAAACPDGPHRGPARSTSPRPCRYPAPRPAVGGHAVCT